jgi:FkbM family methyltransferase
MPVGKLKLKMQLAHKLPSYYVVFPKYDRALPRICQKIKKLDGELYLIDVGANIGDTVALVANQSSGNFLCIEGEKSFYELLLTNIKNIKGSNIFVETKFCRGVGLNYQNLAVTKTKGTAKITPKNTANTSIDRNDFDTLDNIVLSKHKIFANTNILKIDTDGFEFDVLSGSKKLLTEVKPLIYLEYIPELYKNRKQNPLSVIELLTEFGYQKGLFYDNFGEPLGIFNLTENINELIANIDNKKVIYYDILVCVQSSWEKYKEIFKAELNY